MTRTLVVLLIFSGLCLLMSSQATVLLAQSVQSDSLLGISPGAFLALSVANLDTMVSWYRDHLNFSVHSLGTIPGSGIRAALLRHGNALIELLQIPTALPRTTAAPSTTDAFQVHGFFKSGFLVQDIDAAYRHVQAIPQMLAFKLVKPPSGPYRTFGVRDPEGNLIQFFGRQAQVARLLMDEGIPGGKATRNSVVAQIPGGIGIHVYGVQGDFENGRLPSDLCDDRITNLPSDRFPDRLGSLAAGLALRRRGDERMNSGLAGLINS